VSYEFEIGSTRYRAAVASKGGNLQVTVNSDGFALDLLGWDADGHVHAAINGKVYRAVIKPAASGELQVFLEGQALFLRPARRASQRAVSVPASISAPRAVTGAGTVTSPIPGRVVLVRVQAGATVKAGDPLLVLESMKMESTVRAPRAGRVASISVAEGQTVQRGQPLVSLA
jgi:biotin carboxyl carrier protein